MELFGHDININISRRALFGTGAAGAVAAVTIGIARGCRHTEEEASDPVVVDERAATSVLEEGSPYKEVELSLEEKGNWSLATGTVLRPADGTWLPAIAPGATAMPVVKASAFSWETGTMADVVTTLSMGDDPNNAIYDVRCSDSVYAWVEMNLLKREWRLLAQRFSEGAVSGNVSTLWKGNADWDPPQFVVDGDSVIWQVMPALSGTKTKEHSFCYLWHMGDREAQAVVESPGRFAMPPAISGRTITLAPRVRAEEGQYYGITAYSLKDELATVIDQLVLPQSVRPFRAVRMDDVFAFSIEANYSSGGLLGSMGTYIGTGDGPFVTLAREPVAPVAGNGSQYIIKSRASYFVIDTKRETYAILGATNRCVDYGEFPASEGVTSHFVTFATVKDAGTGYPSSVVVRSFSL